MAALVHHCEECGYELTGIGEAQGGGACPECGRPFHVLAPFVLGRPVRWGRAALLMCGPATVAAMFIAVLGWGTPSLYGSAAFLPAMAVVWLGVAVGFPVGVADAIASGHCIRRVRMRRATTIALSAMGLNMLVLVVVLTLLL